MRFLSHFILLTIISVGFITEGAQVVSVVEVINNHLETYSNFNTFEHDNIEDIDHSHSHKHSENGEEHQHKHGLSTQVNYKFVTVFKMKNIISSFQIASNHFITKTMHSSEHLYGIFRPPIY